MKKVLSVLLAVCLLVGALPMAASAHNMGKVGQYQTVSAGGAHTLAIKTDGSLWAWGDNEYGQLGNGTDTDRSTPVKVMDNVAAMSAGLTHSLAIKTDGSLWAWGDNQFGQLGNGGKGNRKDEVEDAGGDWVIIDSDGPYDQWDTWQTVPVKVMDNVAAVSAGNEYSLAIKTDGSLWAWGRNRYGELGDGKTTNRPTPVKVMDNVAAVSAGPEHSLAIKTDGSLWAWGDNSSGELGNGGGGNEPAESFSVYQTVPVKIMDNVAAVCAGGGYGYSLALKTDGSLWAWGTNRRGQLGNGGKGNRKDDDGEAWQTVPVKILDNVAAVSAGASHSLALKTDGSLWAWGENDSGELGNGGDGDVTLELYFGGYYVGDCVYQTLPVKVLDNVAAVSAGYQHSLAIKADGSLWAWGENSSGALGDGTTTSCSTPMQVMDSVKPSNSSIVAPTPYPGTSFYDVPQNAYYGEAVVWAVENNITAGTDKTHFSPNASCTRAQAVTFLWRAAGEPEPQNTTTKFNDVKAGSYYEKAVQWAVENGVTAGTGETTFSPNATCTRAQIVTFLYRAENSPEITGNNSFNDVKTGAYYENAVKWAVENNITSGTGGNKFSPDNNCVRAQIVTFLYRYSK